MRRAALTAAVLAALVIPEAVLAQQPAGPPASEIDVAAPVVRGIVFLGDPDTVLADGWTAPEGVSPIDVSRVPALDTDVVRGSLAPFVGQGLTPDMLVAVRQTVASRYAGIGRPFVAVSVPEQDITGGWLQVLVLEARLGALRVEGNRWFSADALARSVGIVPGDPIDATRLDAAVRWLNLNTFRRVVPVASEGEALGTTDLTLQVQDRFPVAASVSAGNGGNRATGEAQYSAAVEWANALGRGDSAFFRMTAGEDPDVMRQMSGGYTLNLPWRDQITISGNLSRTAPAASGPFGAVGEMSGASARYTWLGRGRRTGVTTMSLAFDWKRTNNDLLFGGQSVFASTAGIAQFVADASHRWQSRAGATTGYVALTFSPGRLVADNDDATFDTQRQGARARYAYARGSLAHSVPLPGRMLWHTRASLQLSNARLLSSEQVSFGGDGSVRGLPVSAATRDQGLTASIELETPSTAVLLRGARVRDQLTGLVFVDYALGWQHDQSDAPGVEVLTAGPGLRYQIGRHSWTQLSYGWVLNDRGVPVARSGRFHVLTQMSF